MNANLQFEFTVNKEENNIHVRREFAADLDLVWEAWTDPEILEQWWAPLPYRVKTKSMDFREGGSWLYAMVSPENQEHWCRADYQKIQVKKSFSAIDAFTDAQGNINKDFPRSLWSNAFIPQGEHTMVDVTISYNSLSDLEWVISVGMQEGFTKALEQMDQYIGAKFRLRKQFKQSNATRVTTYLNFPGNTEEAFLFYQSVFKTAFAGGGIHRFGDIPEGSGHPKVEGPLKNMVLHVELPILGNHVLMATDAPKEMGFTLVQGNNMHISLEPETREEAQRLFKELSAGGTVTMPLQDMFWGAFFGSFTDKYGINWMINHQNK